MSGGRTFVLLPQETSPSPYSGAQWSGCPACEVTVGLPPPLCRCRAFTLWNVVHPEGGQAEHPWSCRVRSDWPRAQWVLEGFGVCASLLGILTHCHSLGSLSSIYSHRSGGGKSDIGCRQVWFLPDCGRTLSPCDLQRLVRVCTLVSVVLEGCQACWTRGHLMTSTLISCLKTL